MRSVCDYVHLDPVRARFLKKEDRLLGYPWSSLGWYLAAPEHRPRWMRVGRLLGEHGIQRIRPQDARPLSNAWKPADRNPATQPS